ncbi:MAG TPA: pyridoxal phosphate-dependent aminotransferase [Bacteroidales bacterium]|nr:pyridoxal phosphate-dependent aminotransferase [Bacteroidales bacterium]HRZ48745.1 pyridoxal phosphate-dependent aminotransferase [Bacteroidales bacterium]
MNPIADRINRMAESETLAMSRMSRELTAQGHHVINLSIGEPDFNTPDFIKEAAKQALDQNYTRYTPVPGYPELRQAICRKFRRDNGLEFTPEQIVVSTGAKHSIANLMMSLVNEGDEVLVPVPYWVSYKEIIKLAGGIPVYVPTDIRSDFKVTPEQLRAAITPKTKVLIYSSPCNPSGSVYSREELRGIADVIAQFPSIYIIADEIYEHINFVGKHESIGQFAHIRDRVITVNGVSKGFAMTGWRLGFIGAPLAIAKACDKLQGQITSGTCSISQRAAIAAMDADPEKTPEMDVMKEAFRKRRDALVVMLKEIPGFKTNIPDGAFYLFPDVSEWFGKRYGDHLISNAGDLSMFLLNEAYVALVPGDAFGSPECLRFSYATSMEELTEAVRRIKEALQKLT